MMKLNAHDERRVAVVAAVDPRTVRAVLAGSRVRSTCAARVRDALVSLGYDVPPAIAAITITSTPRPAA